MGLTVQLPVADGNSKQGLDGVICPRASDKGWNTEQGQA